MFGIRVLWRVPCKSFFMRPVNIYDINGLYPLYAPNASLFARFYSVQPPQNYRKIQQIERNNAMNRIFYSSQQRKRRRRASNFIPPFSTSLRYMSAAHKKHAAGEKRVDSIFFAACLFVQTNFPDSICRRRWIFQQPFLPQLRAIPLQSFRRKTPLRFV